MTPFPRPALRDLTKLPNIVTLLRLALVPVALALLVGDRREAALAVVALLVATDWADGFLARRLGQVTTLGKILDPVADKVAVAALMIFLAVRGEVPVWGAAVVLARDIGILIGAVAMARTAADVPQAGRVGKATALALAVMVLVHVADWQVAEPIAFWCAMTLVVLSGLLYARTMMAARMREQGRGVYAQVGRKTHRNPDGGE
jgi:CDP-diacylglycerol--glycerol-3-phosphate 3-phosphatidyltransferase